MDDEVLAAQRELVRRVRDAGWEVTEAEVSTYDSPWEDDVPEATVTISARRTFPELAESDGGEGGEDADDDRNPFRVE